MGDKIISVSHISDVAATFAGDAQLAARHPHFLDKDDICARSRDLTGRHQTRRTTTNYYNFTLLHPSSMGPNRREVNMRKNIAISRGKT